MNVYIKVSISHTLYSVNVTFISLSLVVEPAKTYYNSSSLCQTSSLYPSLSLSTAMMCPSSNDIPIALSLSSYYYSTCMSSPSPYAGRTPTAKPVDRPTTAPTQMTTPSLELSFSFSLTNLATSDLLPLTTSDSIVGNVIRQKMANMVCQLLDIDIEQHCHCRVEEFCISVGQMNVISYNPPGVGGSNGDSSSSSVMSGMSWSLRGSSSSDSDRDSQREFVTYLNTNTTTIDTSNTTDDDGIHYLPGGGDDSGGLLPNPSPAPLPPDGGSIMIADNTLAITLNLTINTIDFIDSTSTSTLSSGSSTDRNNQYYVNVTLNSISNTLYSLPNSFAWFMTALALQSDYPQYFPWNVGLQDTRLSLQKVHNPYVSTSSSVPFNPTLAPTVAPTSSLILSTSHGIKSTGLSRDEIIGFSLSLGTFLWLPCVAMCLCGKWRASCDALCGKSTGEGDSVEGEGDEGRESEGEGERYRENYGEGEGERDMPVVPSPQHIISTPREDTKENDNVGLTTSLSSVSLCMCTSSVAASIAPVIESDVPVVVREEVLCKAIENEEVV